MTASSCPNDRFRYVVYDNRFDNVPGPAEVDSFQAFAEQALAEGHARRVEKDGAAFSPVTYVPGAHRGLKGVAEVHGIGLDVEHVTPERVDQLWDALDPLEYFAYTTHSHTEAEPRWRVIIPLTRPVPRTLQPKLWELVVELAGADACDGSTKDASRLFYTPAAKPGAPADMAYNQADGVNVFTLDPLEILEITAEQLDAGLAQGTAAALAQPAPTVGTNGLIEKPPSLELRPRPTTDEMFARALKTKRKWHEALQKLQAGQPFAATGGRDAAVYGLVSTLAFTAPEAEVEDIARVFEASIAAMQAGADPSNPPPTMDVVREKARRAINDRRQRWIDEEEFANHFRKGAQSSVGDATAGGDGPAERTAPYTSAELEQLARSQGCSVERLCSKRLIIQHSNAYYVLSGKSGVYMNPLIEKAVLNSLPRDWAPFINGNVVELWTPKADGEGMRQKRLPELVVTHGSVARKVVSELGRGTSTFDEKGEVFIRAAGAVRSDLEPEFNPDIARWLDLMGGPRASKLLDWATMLPVHEAPTAILYLVGPMDTGKTMLAMGGARLYSPHAVPTPYEDAVGKFNAAMEECPLILADEGIDGRHASAALRSLVARYVHKINQKGLPMTDMLGCVRVIVTSNSGNLLDAGSEELTESDVDAVASRVLQVDVAPAAGAFLRKLGGWRVTKGWVAGDGIARHILWLAKNRTVVPGTRFLVAGDAPSLARRLVTGNRNTLAVLNWIARFFLDNGRAMKTANAADLVRVGGGGLWVSVEGVQRAWDCYGRTNAKPQVSEIGQALKSLSVKGTRPRSDKEGSRQRFWVLDHNLVMAWAEETGAVDPAIIRQGIDGLIAAPNPPPDEARPPGSTTSTLAQAMSTPR